MLFRIFLSRTPIYIDFIDIHALLLRLAYALSSIPSIIMIQVTTALSIQSIVRVRSRYTRPRPHAPRHWISPHSPDFMSSLGVRLLRSRMQRSSHPGLRNPQRLRKVRLRSHIQQLQNQGDSSSVSQAVWGIGEVIANGLFEPIVI